MLEKLQHPRINALLLGVLQGLPQGLRIHRPSPFIQPGFDQNLALLIAFGLFAPPLLIGLSFLTTRGHYPAYWVTIAKYVEPYHFMFWGCLSLGLSGLYTLQSKGVESGFAICAFFISAGIGFMVAGLIEKRLKANVSPNAI